MLFHEQIGFKSPSGVRAKLESVSDYPMHVHLDVFEIICVLNGMVSISDCAHDYTLSYGDVYIFNTGDSHRIQSSNPTSILLTIHLDPQRFQPIFEKRDPSADLKNTYFICDSFLEREQMGLKQAQREYSTDIRYLRFLLARLYRDYTADKPSDLQLEQDGIELFEHLMAQFQFYYYTPCSTNKYRIIRKSRTTNDDQSFLRVYRVIDYIYANYNQKVTLPQLAAQEYISVSYLSRYIKRSMGLSFSELLSLARCEAAVKLLGNTNHSLDQIATAVGFSNRAHLITQFKKWFLKTPAVYRREVRTGLGTSKIRFNAFDYNLALQILDSYLDGY